jgi:predicted tellurium resistance membrane protein TerC
VNAILSTESLVSLLALTALEIVLGIDNIVFIAIMVGRLPKAQRKRGYRLGLAAALITRLGLLLTLAWLAGLTATWFTVFHKGFSGRDLVLIGGGVFLLFKASQEIYEKVEDHEQAQRHLRRPTLLTATLQIMVIDIIFSLDSVITAVGLAPAIWVMVCAMICAVAVMMLFAQAIGEFITRNPSFQILALSFLLLIGVLLVADGFGQKVSKGYVYFAMGFSMVVEVLNLRHRNIHHHPKKGQGAAQAATDAVRAAPASSSLPAEDA